MTFSPWHSSDGTCPLKPSEQCRHLWALTCQEQVECKNIINILRWKDSWRVILTGCERLLCQLWAKFFLSKWKCHVYTGGSVLLVFSLLPRSEKTETLLSTHDTWGKSTAYQSHLLKVFVGVTGCPAKQLRTKQTSYTALSVNFHLVTGSY